MQPKTLCADMPLSKQSFLQIWTQILRSSQSEASRLTVPTFLIARHVVHIMRSPLRGVDKELGWYAKLSRCWDKPATGWEFHTWNTPETCSSSPNKTLHYYIESGTRYFDTRETRHPAQWKHLNKYKRAIVIIKGWWARRISAVSLPDLFIHSVQSLIHWDAHPVHIHMHIVPLSAHETTSYSNFVQEWASHPALIHLKQCMLWIHLQSWSSPQGLTIYQRLFEIAKLITSICTVHCQSNMDNKHNLTVNRRWLEHYWRERGGRECPVLSGSRWVKTKCRIRELRAKGDLSLELQCSNTRIRLARFIRECRKGFQAQFPKGKTSAYRSKLRCSLLD